MAKRPRKLGLLPLGLFRDGVLQGLCRDLCMVLEGSRDFQGPTRFFKALCMLAEGVSEGSLRGLQRTLARTGILLKVFFVLQLCLFP